MSLWGATVITNLMSAVPWIGQDIVEFLCILGQFKHFTFFSDSFTNCATGLPVIGTINYKSRTSKLNRLSTTEYLAIPKSFLAFLIGFIDGDGYIGVQKSYNSITVHLTISLHIDDITILNYIQSVLKLGKVYAYPKRRNPSVRLIFTKSELQEVLFPLFLHHELFFLTNTRRAQYCMAMHVFNNNVKKYLDLPSVAPVIQELPTSALEYIHLGFFKDWIVGFACAEGSFFVKQNNDGCFQIKQRLHLLLFESFKLVFNTNRKITVDQEIYAQFGVSSKADIQNVINFFSFSGYHPLVGLKSIQYSSWLEKLRNSERYKNLKFPV